MDNDETQSVASTTLGKIASHYYLDYTSVRLFSERAPSVKSEEDALNLLCDATEFAGMPPHTLQPTPDTLHPTPCTLHPTPCTPHTKF